MATEKVKRRQKIKRRVRKQVKGTPEKPRLTVFKSNKQIYAHLVDDVNGGPILGTSSLTVKNKNPKTDTALEVGKKIAEKAKENKIEKVSFDRNGYLYHGRVKALAEGAREGGLKF